MPVALSNREMAEIGWVENGEFILAHVAVSGFELWHEILRSEQ